MREHIVIPHKKNIFLPAQHSWYCGLLQVMFHSIHTKWIVIILTKKTSSFNYCTFTNFLIVSFGWLFMAFDLFNSWFASHSPLLCLLSFYSGKIQFYLCENLLQKRLLRIVCSFYVPSLFPNLKEKRWKLLAVGKFLMAMNENCVVQKKMHKFCLITPPPYNSPLLHQLFFFKSCSQIFIRFCIIDCFCFFFVTV